MLPLVRFSNWNQKTTFYLLCQIISHWWTLPASVTYMPQVRKPEWLDFTCAFVDCVAAWGGWMAGPRHIVEFMGPSSYTLMVALRWRIHEASSLIDSSVPFLPQPGQAESYYCPNARCSKQSDTRLCTHAQHFQMDSQFQIYIYIYIRTPFS